MTDVTTPIDWQHGPDGFDDIAGELRALRLAAGAPSYSEIARRIGRRRRARGVPEHESTIARSSVYEYFRDGKRRLDVDVLVEIALALGLPEHSRAAWRDRVRAARAAGDGASVVTGHEVVPAPVAEFTGRESAIAEAETARAPVWISGMGGVGKTQLALTLAARAGGGGVFVDARGFRAESAVVDVEAAQRTILRLLGAERVETADEADRAARIRTALTETGRLLVIDDAPGAVAPADIGRVRSGRDRPDDRVTPGGPRRYRRPGPIAGGDRRTPAGPGAGGRPDRRAPDVDGRRPPRPDRVPRA